MISLVPDGENVSITVNGVQQPATVTGGAFSSSFNTSALGVAGSPYTIGYSYGGDSNLTSASNTSQTLTVTKGVPVFSSLSASEHRAGHGDDDAFGHDLAGSQRG